jgi:hypothetical protein
MAGTREQESELGLGAQKKTSSACEELTCDWKILFMCNFWSVRLW